MTFPTTIEAIDAEWLTTAIGAGGRVVAFEAEPIGVGVGLVGHLYRVRLEWDAESPERGPDTVVVKLPSEGEATRFVAMVMRFYEREVRFYQDLSGASPLAAPTHYYSDFDAESHDFALVLGELTGRRVDQLAGCTLDDAEVAVDHLARHHAHWWDSPALERTGWIPKVNDPAIVGAVQVAFAQAWEVVRPVFADLVTPEIDELAPRFPDVLPRIVEQLARPPLTLAHGDYRLDNMFFGPDGGLALCDWQIVNLARGPYDLAYFMTQSVRPDDRRAWEGRLLDRYVAGLARHGVEGYDRDQAFEDYRWAALFCLAYPVVAMGSLDVEDDRHLALGRALFEGAVDAITTLDAISLVT